jgi:hypothetical protein
LTWVDVGVGDFDGNGKLDLVGRARQNGQWWAAIANASNFTNLLWTTWAL